MTNCFSGHTWTFLGEYLVCRFCGKQVRRSDIPYKECPICHYKPCRCRARGPMIQ